MPNGILNPNDFSIDPGGMRSLQDKMLEYKRSLPPSLQGPEVGGQPKETQGEQQQGSIWQQILQKAPSFLGQAAAQDETPPGEKPKPKVGDERTAEFQKAINQGTNPFAPKESIGSPFIGKLLHGKDEGGIFGTGIMPVDVLAFAIGAAITSKMPQDKAIATTMSIAGLPAAFRKNQQEAGDKFIQQKIQALNAETGMQNAEIARTKSVQAQQMYNSRLKRADIARKAGNEDLALAIESDSVDEYMKTSGGQMPNLPPHLAEELDIVAGGGPIAPALRQRGIDTPEKAKALLARMAERQPPYIDEAGRPWIRNPSGGWMLQSQAARQQIGQQPQAITQTPTAIMPQEPVRRLEPTPGGGFMPPKQITPTAQPSGFIPGTIATNLTPEQRQIASMPVEKIYADMSPDEKLKAEIATNQMEVEAGIRMPKELDVGNKAKILASLGTLQYSRDLKIAYEKMVKSYGGDKKFDLKARAQVYAMIKGPTFTGGTGGAGEALLGAAGAGIGAAVEEYGNITDEARDFKGLYDQAQAFARGAMQDTGNLALNERARFELMLGSILYSPYTVRAALREFESKGAKDYNNLLRMNANRIPRGFTVWQTEPEQKQKPSSPPAWFVPINPSQVQPGGEY